MCGPVQPMHTSTLPGMTQMVTPLAESTPMTQPSQMPAIPGQIPPVRDILEPASNEQARSDYLEKQMRQMSSISGLSSNIPPLEDVPVQRPENQRKETMSEGGYSRIRSQQLMGTVVPDSLRERVQNYFWENKVKRKQEWESHRMASERMKESKEQQKQQQSQEE